MYERLTEEERIRAETSGDINAKMFAQRLNTAREQNARLRGFIIKSLNVFESIDGLSCPKGDLSEIIADLKGELQ